MYALGERINDPISSEFHSSQHLIEQAEKLIERLNNNGKGAVTVGTFLVWVRTAIRLAKAYEELKETEVE